ncbi:hypothetical protein RHMOL_Rhmol12G0225700 [Rhododendron molle]|uniref:Uncharacterized protein n=1 Tax=Rhododendron molle TaxID=49168 RepID=A0ACC0LL24_RHOML|nr:hypothetical protein RHMOL_Rhmol12G0225700 [Rhododendron molle]
METNGFFNCIIKSLCFCALLGLDLSSASTPYVGKIYPGFEGSQMKWVAYNGVFLLSNNSVFALRFYNGLDVASFFLVVIHVQSSKIVWTANRGLLVRNTDKFVFDKNGNVYLENATSVVWSTDTKGKGVTSMELRDTGNLVLVGDNRKILWQSFSHPTDTLLSGQEFVEGMILKSFPSQRNLNHYLEIKSNDVILYAGYRTPQVYWSMANDNGTAIKEANGTIFSASIVANSWNFYDRNKTLVWQFRFSRINDFNATWAINDVNATWAAVLGTEGSVSFINLERGAMPGPPPLKIPKNSCGTPEPCNPFVVCSFDIRCQCPPALSSHPNCMPQLDIPCNSSQSVVEMLYIGEKLHYFALGFVAPILKTHLNGCKETCIRNCSCRVLFFENTSGNCFLFDQIGSLQRADSGSSGFTAYIKVQIGNGTKGKKHVASIVIISVLTDEMHMRPPMSKVVQMLEGLCAVPEPPALVQMSSRLYSSFFKTSSEEGISSGLTVIDSVGLLPDVELSGPR